MPPQSKRVFIPCRQITNAKHAHQRFQLVGQRHDHACVVARQAVARKARLVMVFNRIGDLNAQAIVERIVAAHRALQLGEFADHVGDEICFGQLRSLVCLFCQQVATELLTDGPGNRPHALHAFALRAKLVVVDHFLQPLNPRGEGFFAVLVEKEFGISQARAHHALVSADHLAGVFRADVADDQKLVSQLVI